MLDRDNTNVDAQLEALLGGTVETDNTTIETPKTKTKKVETTPTPTGLSPEQFTQFANLIAQTVAISNQTNQQIQRDEIKREQQARENAMRSRAGLAFKAFREQMEAEIANNNYIPYHYAPAFAKRFGSEHEITVNGYTMVFKENEITPIPKSLYQEVLNRFSGLMAKKISSNHIFKVQFDNSQGVISTDEQQKLMETFDTVLTKHY